ncbi:unnamed protein product [Didymodactylos carnosus]|uniref:Tetratricopeptide repeat protein n=1 Tax=Didymodactylos carnosus TaxID=1234261 RepID=A0A816B3C8_9BILA|nr:unnamed protein product [Didymodactylos carnosus]CAF4480649.1 unnamed protein product [Didymodactylos carnosus]
MCYTLCNQFDAAIDYYLKSLTIVQQPQQIFSINSTKLINIYCSVAYCYYKKFDFEMEMQYYIDALIIYQKTLNNDRVNEVKNLCKIIALIYDNENENSRTIERFKRLFNVYLEKNPHEKMILSDLNFKIGAYLSKKKKCDLGKPSKFTGNLIGNKIGTVLFNMPEKKNMV